MKSSLLALIGIGIASTIPWQGERQVFRSVTDSVRVDVSVLKGRTPVPGLAQADFELRDNGVVQRIQEVSAETFPVDVTLLLDISSSVRGPVIDQLVSGARRAIAALRERDTFHVITFNQRIDEVTALGSNAIDAVTRDLRVSPSGATSLLDAIGLSLVQSADQDRRHLVIAFTDGFDTTSLFNSSEIASVAEHSEAVVYAVAIPQPTGPMAYATVLDLVTAATGGQVTLVEAGRTLDQSFAAIINQFRQGYVLRYSPSGVSSTGWHTLDVRVTGRGRLAVNARKGYWR